MEEDPTFVQTFLLKLSGFLLLTSTNGGVQERKRHNVLQRCLTGFAVCLLLANLLCTVLQTNLTVGMFLQPGDSNFFLKIIINLPAVVDVARPLAVLAPLLLCKRHKWRNLQQTFHGFLKVSASGLK